MTLHDATHDVTEGEQPLTYFAQSWAMSLRYTTMRIADGIASYGPVLLALLLAHH
jgi:hypothetical protein